MIAANAEPRELTPLEGDEGIAVYAGSITVDPGHLSRAPRRWPTPTSKWAAWSARCTAWQMNGETLTLGDLLLAPEPDARQTSLAPAVEPRVHNGTLVALAEAYAPPPAQVTDLSARLDSAARRIGTSAGLGAAAGRRRRVARSARRAGSRAAWAPCRPARIWRASASVRAAPRAGHSSARSASCRHAAMPPPMANRPGGGAPAELLTAVLGSLPAASKDDVLDPATTAAIWTLGRAGTLAAGARGHQDRARRPDDSTAPWRRLSAGDQGVAAFVRGMDCWRRPSSTRRRPSSRRRCASRASFGAARAMLGACLLMANREKEAAGLLMSVPAPSVPALGAAGRRSVAQGRPAGGRGHAARTDGQRSQAATAAARRILALAYALSGEAAKGLPALTTLPRTAPAPRTARRSRPASTRSIAATLSGAERRDLGRRPTQARALGPGLRRHEGPAGAARRGWAGHIFGGPPSSGTEGPGPALVLPPISSSDAIAMTFVAATRSATLQYSSGWCASIEFAGAVGHAVRHAGDLRDVLVVVGAGAGDERRLAAEHACGCAPVSAGMIGESSGVRVGCTISRSCSSKRMSGTSRRASSTQRHDLVASWRRSPSSSRNRRSKMARQRSATHGVCTPSDRLPALDAVDVDGGVTRARRHHRHARCVAPARRGSSCVSHQRRGSAPMSSMALTPRNGMLPWPMRPCASTSNQ